MGLNWLAGKTINATQIERTAMDLELWFQCVNEPLCLVMTLSLPGDLDWFEVDGQPLEAIPGKYVLRTEELQQVDSRGVQHYTYRLYFADGTHIDIFADVMAASGHYRIRDALKFRVEDPNAEPWDLEESISILDEIQQDVNTLKQQQQEREAGQLDPAIFAQYTRHF